MQTSPVLSLSPSSPSFNTYSSSNIAEIAARVVEEFRQESVNELDSDIFTWDQEEEVEEQEQEQEQEEDNNREDEDEDEFEFAVVCNKKQDSPVSADEIFFNGQIKPFYPLFDTNLLLNYDTGHGDGDGDGDGDDRSKNKNKSKSSPRIRSPLGKLMREERETDVSLSCSSSEADDLENLQPGTYCVWTPKASKELSPGRCKKSNSTGTSKRWNKFRELLYRSNSDGKDTFVFLTLPSIHNNNKKASVEEIKESNDTSDKKGCKAVEEHYVRNRSIKEEDKKRSFLPYRQDLVGFFHNVNGLSKNLHPF